MSPSTELTAHLWAQLWLMLPQEMTVVHMQDWVAKITSIPSLRALAPDLLQGQEQVLRQLVPELSISDLHRLHPERRIAVRVLDHLYTTRQVDTVEKFEEVLPFANRVLF